MKKTIAEARQALEERKARSAWARGVKVYASELLDKLEETIDFYKHEPENREELDKYLLNGAQDWLQYSEGGCSLVYDGDIAERVGTPSELKKNRRGECLPNYLENWLELQARALYKAALIIKNILA